MVGAGASGARVEAAAGAPARPATDYPAPMSDAANPGTRRQRPLGVVVIAAFLVVDAVLSLAENVLHLGSGTRQDVLTDPDGQVSLLIIVLVALRLVAAVGLWAGWRRGWVLSMLLVGTSLVIDLWLYGRGQPLYARMAIDVVLALYLNQGAVRAYFEPPARGAPAASVDASAPRT